MDEKVKSELMNIDLSALRAKIVPIVKDPRADELYSLCNQRLQAEFGPKFKLDSYIADYNHYCFPDMGKEFTCLHIILNLFMFGLDDHLDSFPEDFAKWVKYVQDKSCPDNGFLEKLFVFLIKNFREVFPSEEAITEMMDLVNLWLKTYPLSNPIRKGLRVSEKHFLEVRMPDSGMHTQFFMHLIASGLKYTKELRANPHWVELHNLVILDTIIINEMYSLKKEVEKGVGTFNYVYVKMINNNISAQQAVNDLISELDEIRKQAYHHGNILKAMRIDGLAEFVDTILKHFDTDHYFEANCKRYK